MKYVITIYPKRSVVLITNNTFQGARSKELMRLNEKIRSLLIQFLNSSTYFYLSPRRPTPNGFRRWSNVLNLFRRKRKRPVKRKRQSVVPWKICTRRREFWGDYHGNSWWVIKLVRGGRNLNIMKHVMNPAKKIPKWWPTLRVGY